MHNAASPVIAAVRWSSGELAAPHKTLDPITLDVDATGTVGLADGKILEVSWGHFDAPTNNAASCPRHDQLNLPNQAPPAIAAVTTPTMMDGRRVDAGIRFLAGWLGCLPVSLVGVGAPMSASGALLRPIGATCV